MKRARADRCFVDLEAREADEEEEEETDEEDEEDDMDHGASPQIQVYNPFLQLIIRWFP
jgi:hypothetical protein